MFHEDSNQLGGDRPAMESQLTMSAPASRLRGVVAAIAAVAVTTLLIYAVREAAPPVSTGVLYLLPVLLVSTNWGLRLGVFTAVASAATFNYFHIPPTGHFTIAEGQNWVALSVLLATALVTSSVSELARSRAAEATRRREEADLAVRMAQTFLGGQSLQVALAHASSRLQDALGIPGAEIVLGVPPSSEQRQVLPLRSEPEPTASLVVPTALAEPVLGRIRDRVVPSLRALVGAALDREQLQSEVVEAQALRRSDDLKTALLRTVSHDPRSPLTAIIASADRGSVSRRALDRCRPTAYRGRSGAARTSLREPPGQRAPLLRRPSGSRPGPRHRRAGCDPCDRSGTGHSARDLPHLFEPFRRGSKDDEHPGSGLGLAIVKGFVEINGGRVRAESSPGQGSVFAIEFAAARSEAPVEELRS